MCHKFPIDIFIIKRKVTGGIVDSVAEGMGAGIRRSLKGSRQFIDDGNRLCRYSHNFSHRRTAKPAKKSVAIKPSLMPRQDTKWLVEKPCWSQSMWRRNDFENPVCKKFTLTRVVMRLVVEASLTRLLPHSVVTGFLDFRYELKTSLTLEPKKYKYKTKMVWHLQSCIYI